MSTHAHTYTRVYECMYVHTVFLGYTKQKNKETLYNLGRLWYVQ